MSKYSKRNKKENKISEEVALDQVHLLIDAYGIDIDEIKKKEEKLGKDQEGVSAYEMATGWLDKLTLDIMSGNVEILEDETTGEILVKQHLVRTSPQGTVKVLEFGEVRASNNIDSAKGKNEQEKVVNVLISMAKKPEQKAAIKQLRTIDLKVVENLGMIFLLL